MSVATGHRANSLSNTPHRPRSRDFGLKVGPTFKEVYMYGEVQNFFSEVMVCDSACERVQHYLKIPVPIGEGC